MKVLQNYLGKFKRTNIQRNERNLWGHYSFRDIYQFQKRFLRYRETKHSERPLGWKTNIGVWTLSREEKEQVSPLDFHFSSVQSLSHIQVFVTPWTAARQASLSITSSQSFLKLSYIKSMMPSNRLILCHPLFLLSSIFPSIRVFSSESVVCIRWPKYWSFSFSISPSDEYSGLISFRMDWLDILVVQGTLFIQDHKILYTRYVGELEIELFSKGPKCCSSFPVLLRYN